MAHPGLGKGMDPKLMLSGVGVAAIGLFFTYVGLFTDYGLRIGPIPVPLSILGPLVVLCGVGVALYAFRQLKCLSCNKPLEMAMAYFPLPFEKQVVEGTSHGDVQLLSAAPMGTPMEPHVQLSMMFCERCRAIGEIEVDAFRPDRVPLIPKRLVTGATVGPLADFVKERSEAHEERHENA